MPAYTNGVYQDHSVPNLTRRGVGSGVSYPQPATRPGMGGNQYSPASPPRTNRGHDGHNNSTYKK